MTVDIRFRYYQNKDREDCLKVFDANCPEFFAPNERPDYADFLDASPETYEVCVLDGDIIGAFGLSGNDPLYKSINWIMISPKAQGLGLGSKFMERAINLANEQGLSYIKIAASHLSAPFFAKYGALSINEIKDGWGANMHRIDMELHL
ncbi:GNAT family N-acetyltransferase [Shewanella sp. Scap07]|uniref:GNAT family N-acetyltransferase n=1 Tax=Shewanella sp. Scap07 TaxID=2589987 RepID=UPI0015BEC9A0|nr:GNAT family N-acetyltransferase [Shewanella sp. Scap07]QLE85301.1 GNAT family N-acetyltransferase [Shewanella sp. Scap07]